MRLSHALATAACSAALVAPSGVAVAESTSVEGTGSLSKLVLANQEDAVVVKLFAPGGKNAVRWVNATVRDKDGTKYIVQGGWYGENWIVSLATEDEVVHCAGLKLTYSSDSGFWKAVLPRTCLAGLANKVKVSQADVNDNTATVNEAGPTKYVDRD